MGPVYLASSNRTFRSAPHWMDKMPGFKIALKILPMTLGLAAFAFVGLTPMPVEAKSSSQARPSSSRPSSSRPDSAFSKPKPSSDTSSKSEFSKPGASAPDSTSSSSKSDSAFSKPGAPAGSASAPASATSTRPPQNAADRALAQRDSQSAFSQLQQSRSQFKNPSAPVSVPPANSRWGNVQPQPPQQVVYVRNNYYGGWASPSYAYFGAPHFGFWNTVFLYYALSHITQPGYGAFYYNHYNDPGMEQFRAQLNTQAADNADLKRQVAEMHKQVEQMKSQPVDPNYLPPNTPPEVAMADALVTQKDQPVDQAAGKPVAAGVEAPPAPQASPSGGGSGVITFLLGGALIGAVVYMMMRR